MLSTIFASTKPLLILYLSSTKPLPILYLSSTKPLPILYKSAWRTNDSAWRTNDAKLRGRVERSSMLPDFRYSVCL